MAGYEETRSMSRFACSAFRILRSRIGLSVVAWLTISMASKPNR